LKDNQGSHGQRKWHFFFYDSVLQWFLFTFAAFLAISQAERLGVENEGK
jgi:hypothetical protein